MSPSRLGILLLLLILCIPVQKNHVFCEKRTENDDGKEEISMDPSKLEYAKGSVCGYCKYCQFCKLCEKDCPCVESRSKPNCKMCKYCKYCYLCSAICDTVCTPGGILDHVSGAIVNSLPSINEAEVDGDIDSVRSWIKKKKDEL